jgi:hypothetical protein
MQTSGTFGALSDGSRKTVVGRSPRAPMPTASAPKPAPVKAQSGHQRGGYAKHAKGGR